MPRTYKSIGYKKRHYEDFAKILGTSANWADIYDAVVILFCRDNPRFNAERFATAVKDYTEGRRTV